MVNLTIVIDDENDNNPVIRNKLLDIFVPNNLKTGEEENYSVVIFQEIPPPFMTSIPCDLRKLLKIAQNRSFLGDVVHVVDGMDSDEDSSLVYNISGPDARFFTINGRGEILAKV